MHAPHTQPLCLYHPSPSLHVVVYVCVFDCCWLWHYTWHLRRQLLARQQQQQQLKTAPAKRNSLSLFRSLSFSLHLTCALSFAGPPFWQATLQRMLTTTREQQRQQHPTTPQHQHSSNNFICMPPLLFLCLPPLAAAPTPAALPAALLLSGTFYESQRLFRTKLIIFTAYAAVVCYCCCSQLLLLLSLLVVAALCCRQLLLLLLFRYHFACAAHLINLMQKSPQRFTLAVPLKLAYLSRWLLFNYAASTASTLPPSPTFPSSPAVAVNLLIYALLTDYCAAPNCHSPEQKAGEKTAQSNVRKKDDY